MYQFILSEKSVRRKIKIINNIGWLLSMTNDNSSFSASSVTQLKSEWLQLLAVLKVDLNLGEKIFADLIKAYSSPRRHYHNLDHLQHLLNSLVEVKEQIHSFPALQLCAWFHDYIYEPQALDNEVQSAVYTERVLSKLGVEFDTVRLVQQIILSTRKHEPLLEETDNLIFLDVDLAILGAATDKYIAYSQAIRQEFDKVSDRDYQKGRTKVLTQFLDRGRIYYTDYFCDRLESQARENLQIEIHTLKNV